jgi:hypothetical protein
MTREHRLLMGLEDLKAIVVACKCGIRLSMSPDKISLPNNCPNTECGMLWGGKPVQDAKSEREKWSTANLDLIDAIKRVRANQENAGFRILLEFNDGPSQTTVP